MEPQNKGMKLTSVEHIGRSQLIPGVGRTEGRGKRVRRTARAATVLAGFVLAGCATSRGIARVSYGCGIASGESQIVILSVVDTENAPIPGVAVTLLSADGTTESAGVSDARGTLHLNLPRRSEAYRIRARQAGWFDVEAKGVMVRDGCQPRVRIIMVVDMSQMECILKV